MHGFSESHAKSGLAFFDDFLALGPRTSARPDQCYVVRTKVFESPLKHLILGDRIRILASRSELAKVVYCLHDDYSFGEDAKMLALVRNVYFVERNPRKKSAAGTPNISFKAATKFLKVSGQSMTECRLQAAPRLENTTNPSSSSSTKKHTH